MGTPIQPLRGERVYLRPMEPDDVELVHRWFADARVVSWMGDLPAGLEQRRRRYDDSVAAQGEDHFAFVICRLCDDERIGRTDVFLVDRLHGSAAFGITIGDPALWGQGHGTDAVNAIADFAFGQLRLERLWLDTDAHNVRAQASYTKAGFTAEGRLRHAFFQDGRHHDAIRMALLREEWLALPRPRSWDLARDRQAGEDVG
jgi:RimJ/RimL family protein N-acetyltransferase